MSPNLPTQTPFGAPMKHGRVMPLWAIRASQGADAGDDPHAHISESPALESGLANQHDDPARATASTITDDQLEALYAERDALRAELANVRELVMTGATEWAGRPRRRTPLRALPARDIHESDQTAD
ncbi:hypothetical protein WKI65_43995 [Streptomyces sp. MS1.AVA.3]|uniref:hypothetical protein n=1 Tax=Streptomyces decoyicus TaxID=249567 RepID=UPI0030BB1F15